MDFIIKENLRASSLVPGEGLQMASIASPSVVVLPSTIGASLEAMAGLTGGFSVVKFIVSPFCLLVALLLLFPFVFCKLIVFLL